MRQISADDWRQVFALLDTALEMSPPDRAAWLATLSDQPIKGTLDKLLALKERNLDQMRRFYFDTLGPLVEHDDRKQGDLIRTLNGFFEANGNLAKAAQDLDVHRNTLVYRLERISELTEMNLDDADNRLILHLALKIQRVLATLSGS